MFPDFIGAWDIAASSGDADWTNDFAAGSIVGIDLVIALTGDTFLSDLGVRQTERGTISSGEIIAADQPRVTVNDPAALIILAIALLGTGLVRGRANRMPAFQVS